MSENKRKPIMMSCMIDNDAIPLPLWIADALQKYMVHWLPMHEKEWQSLKSSIRDWLEAFSTGNGDDKSKTEIAALNALRSFCQQRRIDLTSGQGEDTTNNDGFNNKGIDFEYRSSVDQDPDLWLLDHVIQGSELDSTEFKNIVCEPFLRWARNVTVLDHFIGPCLLLDKKNAGAFMQTIHLIYDAWRNSKGLSKSEQKIFQIITCCPGEERAQDAAKKLHEMLVAQNISPSVLHVEIKGWDDRVKDIHDRYIISGTGRSNNAYMKITKGLDLYDKKGRWVGKDSSYFVTPSINKCVRDFWCKRHDGQYPLRKE